MIRRPSSVFEICDESLDSAPAAVSPAPTPENLSPRTTRMARKPKAGAVATVVAVIAAIVAASRAAPEAGPAVDVAPRPVAEDPQLPKGVRRRQPRQAATAQRRRSAAARTRRRQSPRPSAPPRLAPSPPAETEAAPAIPPPAAVAPPQPTTQSTTRSGPGEFF